MENKVADLREHCIYINLINYSETRNEQSLKTLHLLLYKDFFRVIKNPFYLLPDKIKNQRISKLASAEGQFNKRLNKKFSEGNNYKLHINNASFFETYKKIFLDEICSTEDYQDNSKYSLINPLWEVLNSLDIDKATATTNNYNFTYKKYLILKFSDYYWKYLANKLRNDYINFLNLSTSLNELETKTNENGDTYFFDIFQFKYNLYLELESNRFTEETFNDFIIKHFSQREIEVINLLINGYNLKQISVILNVAESTVRNQKYSIKKKILSL